MVKAKVFVDGGYNAFFNDKKPMCPTSYHGLKRKCWFIGWACARNEYLASEERKKDLPWNKEKAA